MIVVMQPNANSKHIADVIHKVEDIGYRAHLSEGKERVVIGIVGESETSLQEDLFENMPDVDKVVRISDSYKLASRTFKSENTRFALGNKLVGGHSIPVIAGPCSVESREQIIETACALMELGATALRGGAYKPRTSPYSFQGHGVKALEWMAEAREITGLPIVTEVMDPILVPVVAEYADVLQIGARNMQNFTLLNAVGESQHPVLLKRGMSASIKDLLMSAEYILSHGNNRVMLCERGIRTFETETRNTADINAVPVLKHRTHLPVVFDPSHATGYREFVEPVTLAAIAAGCDALIIEVHKNPAEAMSDGRQSLSFEAFGQLMKNAKAVAQAVGRDV